MEYVDLHITHSNHANRLPNAQPNTWHNTTIQTLDAIVLVNVSRRVSNRHLLRTVRVLRLTLHLHADNLNRLVPSTQTATESRRQNLLPSIQLAAVILAGDFPNTLFSQSRKTETGTPVRHLSNSNSIHTLVNTPDALLAVDIHEGSKSARGLDTRSSKLRLCDLDRLHAGAETHCSIRLCHSTEDTTADAGREVRGAEGTGIVFSFGGDKEEDCAFGGGFDPGPGDETLVDYAEQYILVSHSFN